jgi:hypothetical protein
LLDVISLKWSPFAHITGKLGRDYNPLHRRVPIFTELAEGGAWSRGIRSSGYSRMAIFWFLAGMLSAVAILLVLLPWLRTIPKLRSLPAIPWQAPLVASVLLVLVIALYYLWGRPELVANSTAPPAGFSSDNIKPGTFNSPGTPGSAGSMTSAIASLEARLAKGGGTPEDWELLAKSYEFVGRPDAAAQARAHQLPTVSGTTAADAVAGRSVVGEVTLDSTLRAKAPRGATLFIVAKSVDSPGAPVAVWRSTTDAWPVSFTLDDSRSMLPGRNLSSAGRITVEARISLSGQAQTTAGDLRGASGIIEPADHKPLKILINEVVQ